ncbi:glutathione S-transferase family protein [Vibrio mangrovi]|uniref:Glutathione S-transferase family protein n=1 Tax=Vibrio mangrovi TaxID=474394 RepID=A0A1Y6ITM0_9VIBR|nr:glutathione S-transferase family protein [Vibrio mangrovi]MDW6004738.1 glutathione S-transferase family protein [Vibrio mangrovi]SMS01029.1 putative GST-like protein YibF [Vibrio mangrovi]
MKLYLNGTSPYARVVRIAAIEKQLEDRLELCWVDPWQSSPDFLAKNPVSKVPVLETDTGESLTETLLILFYLDRQQPTPTLLDSPEGLALLGLGQALIDAAFQTVIYRKYAENSAQHPLEKRRLDAITRTLATIEEQISTHKTAKNHALRFCDIAIGVALSYLDFRLQEIDWRTDFPHLAQWFEPVSHYRSFTVTRFQ